jgi:hypothetical protein
MKPQRRIVFFVLPFIFLMLILFLTCNAGAEVQKITRFTSRNFDLKVLTADSWETNFGKNPNVPRTDEDVLALARSIYPPLGAKSLPTKGKKWHCGDIQVGLLFAALQNPDIKDETREAVDLIIIQATPPLPEKYTSGRFVIHYTTNDPDPLNHASLQEVKAVASALNASWQAYAAKFTEPMHYHNGDGKDVIDIYLYYMDNETFGQTLSSWVHIDMNTMITNVPCTRKLTAAHELFHRVQFAYGYESGNDLWLSEGSAMWVEKYRYPTEREYMRWMDDGLLTPTTDLFAREYDATYLFVYLTERSTWRAVRDTWANYQTQGAEQAFKNAVEANTGLTFMNFLRNWHTANYVKDLTRAPAKYDYVENEVTKIDCTGDKYGPLTSVPVVTLQYVVPFTVTSSVERYSTEYVVFETPTNPKNLTIEITGGADFSYRIIPVRGKSYLKVYDGDTNPFTFTRPPRTGNWTKVAVLVVGGSSGGNYTITLTGLLDVTYADAYTRTGNYCQDVQSVGVDGGFTTSLSLPIHLAASCGGGSSDMTVQNIGPNHIAMDLSASAQYFQLDPGWAGGTTREYAEGHISSGTYTVEISPVFTGNGAGLYIFSLSVPGNSPYFELRCQWTPGDPSGCSVPVSRDIVIPEHATHHWDYGMHFTTTYELTFLPGTVSGRAFSIRPK